MNQAEIFHAAHALMSDYVDLIDSDRLEDWLDLFTEDARYSVVPRENVEQNLPAGLIYCTSKDMLRDRIVSYRNANEYNLHYDRHVVSSMRVTPLDPQMWSLEANYAVFQTTLEGETRLFSVGRYRDKVRLVADRLLFCEKYVMIDTFSVPTLLATPL